ncbi:hypothetical protein [Haloarcula halophila]|uniref:hypothetical protein n=1 Tax=Haloarcula TaxID=2237 RepID=UPI0023E44373|nr:hypothetical protein [Halomicroarcula sp. DFY41]
MANGRSQLAGAVAAVGGLLWTGWAGAAHVLGETPTPLVGAIVVSTVGVVAGCYAVEEFYGQRMKRPGTAGAWLGGLSGLVFAVGQGLRLATGGGDGVLAVGVLGLSVGSLLVATGLVRTRIQPPWLGVLLALGTIGFLLYEAIPAAAALYGIAWIALGQDFYRYDPPDGRFGESTDDYGWLS